MHFSCLTHDEESLDGLHRDGEAESHQEDRVDEGANDLTQMEMVSCTLLHLGPGPPECVPFPLLGAHGDTGGEEGDGDGDGD